MDENVPALWDSLSKPFFFRIKLVPMKMLDEQAKKRPM